MLYFRYIVDYTYVLKMHRYCFLFTSYVSKIIINIFLFKTRRIIQKEQRSDNHHQAAEVH